MQSFQLHYISVLLLKPINYLTQDLRYGDGNGEDDEPTYWNGFPSADCNLFIGCGIATATRHEKSSDTRPGSSGNYSCKLLATSALGIIANGTVTTGQIRIGSTSASSDDNYDITRQSDANFNQEIDAKPDSIKFWAKFVCPSSSQTAKLSAVIHDNYDYRDPDGSDSNAESHAVAKAAVFFTKGNQTWVQYSAPFDYNHPASSESYILITFSTNSESGQGSTDDVLFIDDVEFAYNTNITSISINGNSLSEYNPNTHTYNVELECGTIPIVTANAQSDNASIDIQQSTTENPTATATCEAGNQTNSYTINFTYSTEVTIYDETCQNEYYGLNDFNLSTSEQSTSGVHNHTIIVHSDACDSTKNLVLTVNPTYAPDPIEQTICTSGSYEFYGQTLTIAGTYEENAPTINGCDSIVTLNLSVGEFFVTNIIAGICTGETYMENGFNQDFAGRDTMTYVAQNGCDSLVVLNLSINPDEFTEIFDTVEINTNYTYYNFSISAHSATGNYTYEQNLQSQYSCDSTVVLYLTVVPEGEDNVEEIASDNLGFELYPNPATDEVILATDANLSSRIDYTIFDLFGKIITTGHILNAETRLDLEKYAAGIYFIQIVSLGNKSKSIKFMKH